MRYLLFIFLIGCTASAQNQSDDLKEDIEFQKLMNKVTETNALSVQVQAKASKKEAELVTKAVATIVSMKGEIKDLKNELNEVKSKVDSVTIDTGGKFVLLPISNN